MYTAIVQPADLYTQMYPEVQTIITRGDTSIPTKAINSAIQECKMYLQRYDVVQLFGDATQEVSATLYDEMLNDMVKNIAVWHLLRLANPNIDLAIARTWYEDTIKKLKDIQKGIATPQGWPYLNTTNETAPQGDAIYATSNRKKDYHF